MKMNLTECKCFYFTSHGENVTSVEKCIKCIYFDESMERVRKQRQDMMNGNQPMPLQNACSCFNGTDFDKTYRIGKKV